MNERQQRRGLAFKTVDGWTACKPNGFVQLVTGDTTSEPVMRRRDNRGEREYRAMTAEERWAFEDRLVEQAGRVEAG